MKKILKVALFLTGALCVSPYTFAANEGANETLESCTKIISALERLACFDRVAQTPATVLNPPPLQPLTARPTLSFSTPVVERVLSNEKSRQLDDMQFIISTADEHDPEGQVIGTEVIISAPALGAGVGLDRPKTYLAISCILNISRFQFITDKPVGRSFVRIQLFMDGKPTGPSKVWQVLDSGRVIDAGRGLVGIDLLRRIGAGQRLSIKSDDPAFDEIFFDATGLYQHIQTERKACHW